MNQFLVGMTRERGDQFQIFCYTFFVETIKEEIMSLILGFDQEHLPAFGSNWRQFFIFGIILVILGLFAISASTFTTILSVVFIGFIIFLSGIIIAFDTFSFWHRKGSGFFLHALFAILYLVTGIILITHPVEGSISLTLVLGIFYLIIGLFRIAFAPTLRAPTWGWSWLNGVITLLLGIMILTSWPASGLFVIGLFVGIDLVFAGWAYIMSALAARKLIG